MRMKIAQQDGQGKGVQVPARSQSSSAGRSELPGMRSSLLNLQRTYGNRIVQRALSEVVQAKLKVSTPGDEYEQEADRVAEQVMRLSEPAPGNAPDSLEEPAGLGIQRVCSGCEEQVQRAEAIEGPPSAEEQEQQLHAKEIPGQQPQAPADLESDLHSIRGSGQPLDKTARAFFEPRFGYDFGQVRVHTDSRASERARSVNALAFTMGKDVVFAAGQYDPDTTSGRRLLAHELTHVVQQSESSTSLMRSPACNCPAIGRDPTATEKSSARARYPHLVDSDWCVTDEATGSYNCIAWTIGVINRWVWDEVDQAGDRDGAVSVSDFDAFYSSHGLTPVVGSSPASAQVALFGNSSGPTHAARKSAHACDGVVMFESKRGQNVRIVHVLDQLAGGFYGDIIKYYK